MIHPLIAESKILSIKLRRPYGPIYLWPICGMQFRGFSNFFGGKIQRSDEAFELVVQ